VNDQEAVLVFTISGGVATEVQEFEEDTTRMDDFLGMSPSRARIPRRL
jgi:hypothetical protein